MLRRKYILLLGLLMFGIPKLTHAQVNFVTGALTAQAAACPTSPGSSSSSTSALTISTVGYGGATFTLGSSAFSATVSFYGSGDGGTTWQPLNTVASNATSAVLTATATGLFQTNVAGYTNVCMVVTTFVSGTVTARIQLSTISARAGGGVSGGGLPAAPTSPNGVSQSLTSTPSGGVAGPATFSLPGLATRRVTGTGTTDTILAADCSPGVVSYQGNPTGANIFVTLPTATTLGVPNCVFDVQNSTTNGATVTITPTGWTFITPGGTGAGAGATQASLILYPGQIVEISPDPSGSSWDFRLGPGGALTFDANYTYGVLSDTHINWAPSWTNTSSVVTCATCNFLSTAKVGQIVFGTNASPLGGPLNGTAVVQLPQGTISSIDSNTQIHASTTANANWTIGPLIWGDDDTSALQSAWTAASNACALLHIHGVMLTQKAQFITAPTTQCVNNDAANRQGPGVTGDGQGITILIPTPSFDPTTCTGGSGVTCFLGDAPFGATFAGGMVVKDWEIWGAGNSALTGFGGKHLTEFAAGTVGQNWACIGWGGNTGNTFGMFVGNVPGSFTNVQSDACGGNPCRVDTTANVAEISFQGVYCGDSTGPGGLPGLDVRGALSSVNSYYFPQPVGACAVQVESVFNSSGDTIGSTVAGAQSFGLCVNGGGTANTTNDQIIATSANDVAVDLISTGSLHATNTTMQGGSTGPTLLTATGSTFFDACGNSLLGSAKFSGTGLIFGSCSITGTACATGNWALTSGWGTSSIASVTANGDSHRCQVVITGAAGSAGPVLTWTFPTAYLLAPGSCQISFNGTLTGESTGAPSATSVAFTFTGTPSAQTYRLDASCGP